MQRDLGQIPLINILQALMLNGQEGVLTIRCPEFRRRIRILQVGIRPLDFEKSTPDLLKLVLAKQKLLSESQLHNIFSTWSSETSAPGDFLIRRRIIEEADVRNSIREQLENAILEIFLAPDVEYEFSVDESPDEYELFDPEGLGEVLIYNPNSILMEAARRQDEWTRFQKTITSEAEIYTLVDPAGLNKKDLGISPQTVKELRPLLNGTKTVRGLVDATTLSKFAVFEALDRLVELEIIRTMELADKRTLAERLRRSSQVKEAKDLYLSILATQPEDTESRSRLITILEGSGEDTRALFEQYSEMAQILEKTDVEQAAEYLKKALGLIPTSIEARRSLFNVYYSSTRHREAIGVLKAGIAQERENPSSVDTVRLLQRLAGYYPEEVLLFHELAEAYLATGDTESACRCLHSAADLYNARKDSTKYCKVLDQIATLQPEDAPRLRKLMDAQRKSATPKKRRSFRAAVLATVSGSLLSVGALVALTEYNASAAFAECDHIVQRALDDEEGDKSTQNLLVLARALIDDYQKSYPISSKSGKIRGLLKRIEERETALTQAKQANLEERKKESERLLLRAFVEESKHEFSTALDLAEKVDLEILSAARMRQAKELRTRLRSYFSDAKGLVERAKSAREQGDIARSHRLITKLIREYPQSEAVKNVRLPIYVDTKPPGATLIADGTAVGETPDVFDFLPSRFPSIRLVKRGYEPFDLDRTPINGEPFNPLEMSKVSIQLKKGSEWEFQADSPIECTPVSRDGHIYFGTRAGTVYCLEQDTGETIWRTRLPGGMDLLGGVGLWGDLLYFGTYDGKLHILRAQDGDPAQLPVQATSSEEPIRHAPSQASIRGIAAFNCGNEYVVSLGLNNGKVAWRTRIPELLGGPINYQEGLYSVTRRGSILHLSLDSGEKERQLDLGVQLAQPCTIGAGRAFTVTQEGVVVALDIESWKKSWAVDLEEPVSGPLACDGQSIVASTVSGRVVHLSTSGDIKSSWTLGTPLTSGGTLFRTSILAGTPEGSVHSLDFWANKRRWSYRPAEAQSGKRVGFLARGIVSEGRFFIGCENSTFYCFVID